MLKQSWPFIGAFLCALGLAQNSCDHSTKMEPAGVSTERWFVVTPHDRYPDDLGRFLAALPGKPGSPFADLECQPAWVQHQRDLDRAWSKIAAAGLPEMETFQKQELGPTLNPKSTVFYPFSGPDALMATTFFPANPTYVMVGLEPAGTLPAEHQLERKNLERYLASVRTTLASELSRSFFITRQMDRQFRGQVTDGLFLPILELLVRSNHTIWGIRYVRVDEAGQLTERPPENRAATGPFANEGVEIDFRRDDDGSAHKLVYLSVNLSDDRLRGNRPFLAFLGQLKGITIFLKATSYMVHKPEFSVIRQYMLSASATVLQDDSGIPYRFFATGAWAVQLYGIYVRPYGSFRWLEQADLRQAYLTSRPKPLDFRIGYGYGRIPSNLLFARRLN
jgi:hypothetical protein